jgi:hypothetical protein
MSASQLCVLCAADQDLLAAIVLESTSAKLIGDGDSIIAVWAIQNRVQLRADVDREQPD